MNEKQTIGRFRLPAESEKDARRLGNLLRRYLLTDIPGMAPVAARIEGVQHEYQAVDSVREDALELISNIRNIRISSQEKSARAVLDSTNTEVCAGELKIDNGSAANPDLVIAHLSKGARLRAEILFELGKDSETVFSAPEGFIPIKTRFCPVKRVGVTSEQEALSIEIETNGSIPPDAALVEAMKGIGDVRSYEAVEVSASEASFDKLRMTGVELAMAGIGRRMTEGGLRTADAGLRMKIVEEFTTDPFAGTPPPARDITKDSYTDFLENGIPRLLEMLFPLTGAEEARDAMAEAHYGKSARTRGVDLISYRLETPDTTADECIERDTTYQASLLVKVRVRRSARDGVYGKDDPKAVTEQEVDMGTVPLLGPDGRFVINGCHRTWVTALADGMRIRPIGEVLMQELGDLITRMKPVIEERIDGTGWLDTSILNLLPLTTTINDMLGTASAWCQYSDETNPLSLLVHRNRTALEGVLRGEFDHEARALKPYHFGRLDYLETPEGPNIGIINSLALYAKADPEGRLLTPYKKVTKGKIASELTYLSSEEEAGYKIADASAIGVDGNLKDEDVLIRDGEQIRRVPAAEVQYVSISPVQSLGYSTSLVPFLGHDDPNRALMGANMLRQAPALTKSEQPFVKTGTEACVASYSGQMVVAKRAGKVISSNSKRIIVRTNEGDDAYDLIKFRRSLQATCINQNPIVAEGDVVAEGQVLADTGGTSGGEVALGKNILVAYMPFRGYNFEDAICISDELISDETFTSVSLQEEIVDVGDAEVWTAPVGTRVNPGDALVQEASGKKRTLFTAERHNPAVVIKCTRRGGMVKFILAEKRSAEVGDKFSSRHGSKGCIAKVLPRSEMPYLEDGTPVQMVLNTVGVVSRLYLGQILELHYGLLAHALGTQFVIPPFAKHSDETLRSMLREAGLPETGMFALYDGATGRAFESPVTVGYLYLMKLAHMVEDKMRAVSVGKSSLITHQPMGWYMGQRLGTLEMWALEAYGAGCTLQEFLTVKSDDLRGREKAALALLAGEDVEPAGEGESLRILENALRGLGIRVEEER